MAKPKNSLLKKAIKYSAIYALGVATVAALWWASHVAPEDRACGGPVPYYVEVNGEQLYGYDLCREIATAHAYLYEPLYLFQRQKGVDILEGLAAKGVVDSMGDLAQHYRDQRLGVKKASKTYRALTEKSLYWARMAASHGDPVMLGDYLYRAPEDLTQEDIETLEGFAMRHAGAAIELANFYKTRDPKKSEKWLEHYKTGKDFLPLPVSATITLKQITYPYK